MVVMMVWVAWGGVVENTLELAGGQLQGRAGDAGGSAGQHQQRGAVPPPLPGGARKSRRAGSSQWHGRRR